MWYEMKYHKEFNCNLVDMEASIFAKLSSEGFFKQAETYIIRFISDNYDTLPPFDEAWQLGHPGCPRK